MKEYKLEDFYDTKIRVDTPEKSRRFQELIFSLGGSWGIKGVNVSYTSEKFLYFTNNGLSTYRLLTGARNE